MPTPTGGETIAERLTRLRVELARVRTTVERAETNGQAFNLGGAAVTQIAYEQALRRRSEIEAEIRNLEARLAGSRARSGIAIAQTRMPS